MSFYCLHPEHPVPQGVIVAYGHSETPVRLQSAWLGDDTDDLEGIILVGGTSPSDDWIAVFGSQATPVLGTPEGRVYEMSIQVEGVADPYLFDVSVQGVGVQASDESEPVAAAPTIVLHPPATSNISSKHFVAYGKGQPGSIVPAQTYLDFPGAPMPRPPYQTPPTPVYVGGLWLLQWKNLADYVGRMGKLRAQVAGRDPTDVPQLSVMEILGQLPKP